MKDCVENKHIVLLSPLPPPVGGIATWTVQLLGYYQKLTPMGYRLIHYNTAVRFKRITDKGLVRRVIAGVRDFWRNYRRIVSEFGPPQQVDVAHITSSGSIGMFKDLFVARFFKKKGARVIVHYRFGRIAELYERKNWEWKILLQLSRCADSVIVLDSMSKAVFDSEDINCRLLPNPISLEKIDVFSEAISREKGRVVFIGHVIYKKGVFELVEVLKDLDINCNLRIIGPYEEEVKATLLELADKKANQITFVGQLNEREVLQELQLSEVFVLPSHTEGFPNAVLEAMAMGCCVIASSVGAIPDMLSGNCGLCIPPNAAPELKGALEKVLMDERYAQTLGVNARNKVMQEYNLEKVYEKLEELWLED